MGYGRSAKARRTLSFPGGMAACGRFMVALDDQPIAIVPRALSDSSLEISTALARSNSSTWEVVRFPSKKPDTSGGWPRTKLRIL